MDHWSLCLERQDWFLCEPESSEDPKHPCLLLFASLFFSVFLIFLWENIYYISQHLMAYYLLLPASPSHNYLLNISFPSVLFVFHFSRLMGIYQFFVSAAFFPRIFSISIFKLNSFSSDIILVRTQIKS